MIESRTPEAIVADRYSVRGVASRNTVKCFVSRRVEGREFAYEYRILRLRFPANTIAPDGSTELFRWRVQEPGHEPVVVGTCHIPSTPEAAEFALKLFKLDERRGPRGDDGMASIQTCVREQLICPIDGIIVIGPSSSTWGWSAGGGGFSMGGGCDGFDASVCDSYGYSEGDTPDPGPDGTYRPECDRDANKICVTRELMDGEWGVLREKISKLRTPTEACARAKAILQEFHALGASARRIRGWDGYDVQYDSVDERYEQRFGQVLSDAEGRYIEFDIGWIMADRTNPDELEVLAHEALHIYLHENRSPMTLNEAHTWIGTEQASCAGNL